MFKRTLMLLATLPLMGMPFLAQACNEGDRATGGGGLEIRPGYDLFVAFTVREAFEEDPVRGHVEFHQRNVLTGEMRFFSLVVERADVNPFLMYATFSGLIVQTNYPDWEGMRVQFSLRDRATPGWRGDTIGFGFFDGPPGLPYGLPAPLLQVERGNYVIHPGPGST